MLEGIREGFYKLPNLEVGILSKRLVTLGAILVGAVAFMGPASAPARAADRHVIDQMLSLTGDCATSEVDPVPDPGCVGEPPEYPSYKPNVFKNPCGTATDSHGYVYVASTTGASGPGWIDVFDASGNFVTLVDTGGLKFACDLAVDSTGRVYVSVSSSGNTYRYTPKAYPPPPEVGAYGEKELCASNASTGVTVDPSNDHVYIATGGVAEYTSNCEFLGVVAFSARFVGVWGRNHDIYVSDLGDAGVRIVDGTTNLVKEEIEVRAAATDTIGAIAVDQANGDFYVQVCPSASCVIKQYGIRGGSGEFELIDEIGADQNLTDSPVGRSDVAVDSPCLDALEASCDVAGYDSPNASYLFAGSGSTNLYAFAPLVLKLPTVSDQTVTQITTNAATLRGKVAPNGGLTEYHFEYVDRGTCEADLAANGPGHCFDRASSAGSGEIPEGAPATAVSVPVVGLLPDTDYRFRVVASNHCNPAEPDEVCASEGEATSFATYPESPSPPAPCPNAAFRTGFSALLPDCRAYELVTPSSTIPPQGWLGEAMDISLAAPAGGSVLFGSGVGALPGTEGNGVFDGYEAVRASGGWNLRTHSPSEAQTGYPLSIGASSDNDYSIWAAQEAWGGILEIPNIFAPEYIRRPGGAIDPRSQCSPEGVGGEFELIACGSLGVDPGAQAQWLSDGAAHMIFATGACLPVACGEPQQLELDAAPSGTGAVYDRLPDGAVDVVSIKPTGDPFSAGEGASYLGASASGSAVAFQVGTTTYVRVDGAETLEVGDGIEFAGLSDEGSRLFYLEGGDAFAFDTDTEAVEAIGSGGESTLVHVAEDGSRVYFSSPLVLTGEEANEQDEKAESGLPNLYLWNGATVAFVATLDPIDFTGEVNLGNWVSGPLGLSGPAAHRDSAFNPSRLTADGSVLLFESRAALTGEGGGHTQIYRYDADSSHLGCLSCNPTGAPLSSDSRLQRIGNLDPLRPSNPVANLTDDGEKAFFESSERLVSRDTDGLVDVYEWEAEGVGGCTRAAGCLSLISGGPGAAPDYLWGVSSDGADVFIRTADTLLGSDTDFGVASIYDAREGGGFAEPAPRAGECLGEACQPTAVPLNDPTPASANFVGSRVKSPKRCPKGKRRVRRGGKVRCVPKRQRKHHRGKAKR